LLAVGALSCATALALATHAEAGDGNMASVLVEAGCPAAKIDKLSDRNGTTTYRANCFSTSHKAIIVTCIKGLCVGGPALYDRREDQG